MTSVGSTATEPLLGLRRAPTRLRRERPYPVCRVRATSANDCSDPATGRTSGADCGATLLLRLRHRIAAVEILPGDVASNVLGQFSSETARTRLREQLHLDEPALSATFCGSAGSCTEISVLPSAAGALSRIFYGRASRTLSFSRVSQSSSISHLPCCQRLPKPSIPIARLITRFQP